MFISKKEWEALNERVRRLEAQRVADKWERDTVETFEYGRTTMKSMIRRMAAHMYKEETASRGNGKQPQKD